MSKKQCSIDLFTHQWKLPLLISIKLISRVHPGPPLEFSLNNRLDLTESNSAVVHIWPENNHLN